jgi:hypothetical protein
MHLVLLLVALLILLVLGLLLMGAMISGPRYRGPVSDHFDGSTFINPGGAKAKGGFEVFKWMLSRKRGPWEEDKSEDHGPRPLAHFKGGIRVTFVNHSTFLIQVPGRRCEHPDGSGMEQKGQPISLDRTARDEERRYQVW